MLLSCGREPTGPHGANAGVVRSQGLAWVAEFPSGLAQYQAAGGGVPFTKVRVVLNNPDGSVALDTLIDFPPGATEITATLSVILPANAPATGQPLFLSLDYRNAAGVSVFRGGPVTVTAVPLVPGAGPPPPTPVSIPLTYTGPGATATRVAITPKTVSVPMGGAFAFTAQAFDATGAVVPNTPIVFNIGNGALGTFNAATGSGTAANVRGSTTVTAQLLTPVAPDAATLTVFPVPSALAVVSGSGQTGPVNSTLPNPLVVRVTAVDGLPVAGTPVNFTASAGGTVAAAVTDAGGLASTTWKLGGTVLAQTVTATTAGTTPVTFSATANSADPARLEFVGQPPATVASGAPFSVSVRAVDGGGHAAEHQRVRARVDREHAGMIR